MVGSWEKIHQLQKKALDFIVTELPSEHEEIVPSYRRMPIALTILVTMVLLTMFDIRLNLSKQVAAEAIRFFEDRVYKTVIPRNVKLSESPSVGRPILPQGYTAPSIWGWRSGARNNITRLGNFVSVNGEA